MYFYSQKNLINEPSIGICLTACHFLFLFFCFLINTTGIGYRQHVKCQIISLAWIFVYLFSFFFRY